MEAPPAVSRSDPDGRIHTMSLSGEEAAKRELVVKRFAELLSTKTNGPPALQYIRTKGLTNLIADTVSDDEVVLVLPSLDMKLSEDEGTANAMPKIGETRTPKGLSDELPTMAASVLTAASNNAAQVEQKAATNMSKLTSWTRSTLTYASHAVATNVSEFFSNLIDSRLRAWTLLLLRHSLSTGDAESRKRLLSMLSASISVKGAETNFKTLALPESAESQPKEADSILPLLFEVSLHLTIQEKAEMITLRAPGTISAFFDTKDKLKKVVVRLDTGVMLSSMVDQARVLVFKAVANATKSPIPLESSGTAPNPANDDMQAEDTLISVPTSSSRMGNPAMLSGFRSALNLSSTGPGGALNPSLQKARSSALRLNSVLYGNITRKESKESNLGTRRIRSLKWDSPLQVPTVETGQPLPPSAKKPRMADTAAKLKSFKSFGRPHAGVFGSGPRNATFGEYNRAHMWGRDGRMVHHPAPMQGSFGLVDQMGVPTAPDKNATFDLLKHRQKGFMSASVASAMPRTATVLEKLLMKTSTSGGNL